MRIDIICVGRIKERFFTDAIDEYSKRLSRYVNLNIFEVKDEKTPENASEKEISIILSKEAERILKYINEDAALVPLCIEGIQVTSEGFADFFTKQENASVSHIQFIIGGSLGLHDDIKKLGSTKLSFSKMTFPHQLMRVVLLEQIYRAYRIKNNEPYHK